jgi:hypothetical protein
VGGGSDASNFGQKQQFIERIFAKLFVAPLVLKSH